MGRSEKEEWCNSMMLFGNSSSDYIEKRRREMHVCLLVSVHALYVLHIQVEFLAMKRKRYTLMNIICDLQSAYLGSFMNISTIESQYNYQLNIRKCVVVVYDPIKTVQVVIDD